MTEIDTVVEQMRADFPEAALWMEWSAADQADIGACLRELIEAENLEALTGWAADLARHAANWRRVVVEPIRAMECRIRAEREARAAAAEAEAMREAA